EVSCRQTLDLATDIAGPPRAQPGRSHTRRWERTVAVADAPILDLGESCVPEGGRDVGDGSQSETVPG
ncbi:MAG: hypothetical protein PGN37_14910, partial [Mycobacterium kyogaense]|uniref:hypothetical protein n=1 Tax=Mycobacterium kyogaense TaxID=2212479 RepID=UPI002FF62A72